MSRPWRHVGVRVQRGDIARLLAIACMLCGGARPALAADKLVMAPVPGWVVPVAIPTDAAAVGQGDSLAVRLLLSDEQVDLQPGQITHYQESVYKLQTAQGLGAGAIAFAWDPATQAVTVHKLLIRRGVQVIDVLAGGQTFVIARRETNLENAVLDGQLTASIQPEGLQVGDIIDLALSIATRDPAVGNHIELIGAAWNAIPIARAHWRAQWPAGLAVRLQANGGLALAKPARKGGLASVELTLNGIVPPVLPKQAPPRYQLGRFIELTDLPSWAATAAVVTPLFDRAEVLSPSSPVRAEIARIKALSPDPKVQAEAALALVQDRVRYVLLSLNDGGLIPADADTTWSRRFGDCKGKTVLLLAILHGLGIDAHPVLVSTRAGDGLTQRLPAIGLFDHVLVNATIGGRGYWLDGTRVGDRVLDAIETPGFYWGLPLVPGAAAPVAMAPPADTKPRIDVAITIDAHGGVTVPAPIHIERTLRGDPAVVTNLALANLAGAARDDALRQFWKSTYDFAEPATVQTAFDPLKRELRLTMDGTTKMDWNSGWYEADHVWMGFKADFSRDAGADLTAPYAVDFPSSSHVVETILLPTGIGTFTVAPGSDVDQVVAGHAYHRHATVADNRFVVEAEDRAVSPEFPAAQASAAQDTLRALFKNSVYLRAPTGYAGTQAERDAVLASDPTTAPDMLRKARMLIAAQRFDEGLVLLDKAIALDPHSAEALMMRAFVKAAHQQIDAARADVDAALVLEPRNVGALLLRGQIELERHEYAAAVATLTTCLDAAPGNVAALTARTRAYSALGHNDLALADSDIVIKATPQNAQMRLLRANILRRQGDSAGEGREADALMATSPTDIYTLMVVSRIYAAINRQDEAMATLDRALAIKPDASIYLNRFAIRPKRDLAGRQADLDAALRLEPTSADALFDQAQLAGERGDWTAAVATLTRLIATGPHNGEWLGRRGIAYAKAGDRAAADKDFDAARALAGDAHALNGLCWMKAQAGVALERALAECDAAMAMTPGAADVEDSRALVLLRLDRVKDALAQYQAILAKVPTQAPSLYGRAVAEARTGDPAGAARDAAAALKIDPRLAEAFDDYGLALKVPTTGAH